MENWYVSQNSAVTLGLPFYRNTNLSHLKQAIDSILNQSHVPEAIHLLQDGPVSKELSSMVEDYKQKNEQIEHIVFSQNQGLPYVLNYSILHSVNSYYARMDSDDIAHPERIEKQRFYLEENPGIDILGTEAWEFTGDPWQEECFLKKMPADPSGIENLFHYRSPLIHPSVMFRRSVFAKIGLYNVNFYTEQDLELWARALQMKVGITNLQEPLLYYRDMGMVNRRSEMERLLRQFKARYSYNTWSPRLNALKVASLVFRVMPASIRKWGYKRLR